MKKSMAKIKPETGTPLTTQNINNTSGHVNLILKGNFEIYLLLPLDRQKQSCFCSAEFTPQLYHWYATTRFAVPRGQLAE